MIRIIIICEGETEKEFCLKILNPHFSTLNRFIYPQLIKKSMGGIVRWTALKNQILLCLKTDQTVFVSTLIDYYGIYAKHEFPKWDECEQEPDKNKRMLQIEQSMLEDIDDDLRYRFIPYLQLHEFEGLLFNDIKIFHEQIPAYELIGTDELSKTFRTFNNPELINNNRETSPSHRLTRIISGYNKVVYGNILAEAIGLTNIRAKSPRFNDWITKIEALKPPKK